MTVLALVLSNWNSLAIPCETKTASIGDFQNAVSGYRYYSPTLGRWLSRDPLRERCGNNLYNFNFNSAIGRVDTLGGVSYHLDTQDAFHVHDYIDGQRISYGLRIEDGAFIPEVRSSPKHPFDAGRVSKSVQGIMSDPNELRRMHRFISDNFDQVFSAAGRESALARSVRVSGRNLRRMSKLAGPAAAAGIIFGIISSSDAYAATAESYGRHIRDGNRAMADLDAIEIAMAVHEASGNYFITVHALDILLAE